MGNVYTRFSDQNGTRQKPYPLGRYIPLGLYKGLPPPPGMFQNKSRDTVVVGRVGAERYIHSYCRTVITTIRLFFSN